MGYANKMASNIVQLEGVLSSESNQLMDFVVPHIGLTVVAPPKTNPEALKLLRAAFGKMIKDAGYLAANKKQNIALNPLNHDGVKKVVEGIVNISPTLLAQYRKIITE